MSKIVKIRFDDLTYVQLASYADGQLPIDVNIALTILETVPFAIGEKNEILRCESDLPKKLTKNFGIVLDLENGTYVFEEDLSEKSESVNLQGFIVKTVYVEELYVSVDGAPSKMMVRDILELSDSHVLDFKDDWLSRERSIRGKKYSLTVG